MFEHISNANVKLHVMLEEVHSLNHIGARVDSMSTFVDRRVLMLCQL